MKPNRYIHPDTEFTLQTHNNCTFPAPVDTDKRARDNLAPPVVKFGTAQLERKKMLWVQPASFLQIRVFYSKTTVARGRGSLTFGLN